MDQSQADTNPAVAVPDSQWLRDKLGYIRNLSRRIAEDLSHLGKHLCEVRDNIPGGFAPWVEAHLSFGRKTAYRMMDVWTHCGSRVAGLPIDATALYLISSPSVPKEKRETVIAIAESGQRVTPALAREVIESRGGGTDVDAYHRDREAGEKQDAEPDYRGMTEKERKAAVGQADKAAKEERTYSVTRDFSWLWREFSRLVNSANSVVVTRVTDVEEDRDFAKTGGLGDLKRGLFLPVMISVHPDDGSSVRTVVSQEGLEVALIQASGKEEPKKCLGCRKVKREYSDFSKKNGGRCPQCKVCERARVKVAKKQGVAKRGGRKVTSPDPTAEPTPPTPSPSEAGPTGTG